MKNKSAQGFGGLLVLLIVALIGTSGYFLLTNNEQVRMLWSKTKTKISTDEKCISQAEYDLLVAQAYEANDEESIKYLEDMIDKIICTASVEGKTPEIEPPLPPKKSSDKYSGYQYNNCFFCESDMQMCQVCWENDFGDKVCCLKSVQDNADDTKNKCAEGDRILDPDQVARCRD